MRITSTDSLPADKSTPSAQDGTRSAFAEHMPVALIEYVDSALSEAFSRTYFPDPVIGADLIRLLGPLDSVRRRHGILIERALAHALAVHARFDVQSQVAVPVSRAAIDLCAANASTATEHLALAVSDARTKTVVPDLVVYDRETQRLIVASVKRGGGIQGGTAAHDDHIEQRAAALILRTMIAAQGLPVMQCESIVIDWYARSGIVGVPVVTGPQLDSYFGVPISSVVEAMSRYLTEGVRQRAAKILSELLPDSASRAAALAAAVSAEASVLPEVAACGRGADGDRHRSRAVPRRAAAAPARAARCKPFAPARRLGRTYAATAGSHSASCLSTILHLISDLCRAALSQTAAERLCAQGCSMELSSCSYSVLKTHRRRPICNSLRIGSGRWQMTLIGMLWPIFQSRRNWPKRRSSTGTFLLYRSGRFYSVLSPAIRLSQAVTAASRPHSFGRSTKMEAGLARRTACIALVRAAASPLAWSYRNETR